jgi:hypothetical protein
MVRKPVEYRGLGKERLGFMKRLMVFLASVFGLISLSMGQMAQQTQQQTQVGPIYPPNPSYNFYSRQANADPLQFNWDSGQWEFVGNTYSTPTASNLHQSPVVTNNWNGNMPDYSPVQSGPGAGSVEIQQQAPAAPVANNPPTPDAETPTPPPATQPSVQLGTQTVKFSGKLVSMHTVDLVGVAAPHLILKLLSSRGATGIIDVGTNLDLPDLQDMSELKVTATGKLGVVDGNLVLFANTLAFGNKVVKVDRGATTRP